MIERFKTLAFSAVSLLHEAAHFSVLRLERRLDAALAFAARLPN